MRRAALWITGCGIMLLVGCVGQGDYDQLMFKNRALESEKLAAEQRALDAEAQAESLRNQLRLKEGELDKEKQMVASLTAEKDGLYDKLNKLTEMVEKLKGTEPSKPIMITPLPPELDKALKEFAAAHPDMVEYDSERGVVKWKSDMIFTSGSDMVEEKAKSPLRSFCQIINTAQAQAFDVVIVGHTDNDPIKHSGSKHPTNWHLSAHRAIAVSNELMSDKISPKRVGVMGYGEFRPIATNDTDAGKQKNRRVEVYLVSHGEMASTGATLPAVNQATEENSK